MVLINNNIENVLNRILLVKVAYKGTIPSLYTEAKTALAQLDESITTVKASAVNNAPFAWKRDNALVLRVGNLMFSYYKDFDEYGNVIVLVNEVAEDGKIVTENAPKSIIALMERIDNLYRNNK
ncbi:MAG: hypothetical protein IKT53_03280 [Bacteroidaceae bacterium]|nr:hypothetical protein [Bacteroidaceae bacterium]